MHRIVAFVLAAALGLGTAQPLHCASEPGPDAHAASSDGSMAHAHHAPMPEHSTGSGTGHPATGSVDGHGAPPACDGCDPTLDRSAGHDDHPDLGGCGAAAVCMTAALPLPALDAGPEPLVGSSGVSAPLDRAPSSPRSSLDPPPPRVPALG